MGIEQGKQDVSLFSEAILFSVAICLWWGFFGWGNVDKNQVAQGALTLDVGIIIGNLWVTFC